MDMPSNRTTATSPARIPINDPHLLAKLWEKEEIRARQDVLTVIAEHINLANADLTIVAWERLLSLFEHLDHMYALNMKNAKIHTDRLGVELAMEERRIDSLSEVLERIDLPDSASRVGAKIHPARHLVCNIGVIRAGTIMKTAYALMRSTYANEPTSGLSELMSRLDQHQRSLGSEILEYRNRAHQELLSQGYDVTLWSLMPEIDDLNRTGVAYWKVSA